MPVPMKIFIFPLTLALSLGLTGWMFASYRQNQEQFRQAGQKTADLEKEKSSLEEEIKKYQASLQDSASQDMPALEKQEHSFKQQIIEQERNTKTMQRLLQEGEQQRHALKIKEEDLKSRLQDLSMEKKKEGGSAVHAPKSIAGATITIEYKLEGENRVFKQTLPPNDYFMEEKDYVPQGNTAFISFGYSEPFGAARFMNHTITGARSFNELMDADKTRPAIITFTHKKGNTYTGTIKGYMVNDRMPSQGTRLSGITITLPQ